VGQHGDAWRCGCEKTALPGAAKAWYTDYLQFPDDFLTTKPTLIEFCEENH
jgi:hypothetical protein